MSRCWCKRLRSASSMYVQLRANARGQRGRNGRHRDVAKTYRSRGRKVASARVGLVFFFFRSASGDCPCGEMNGGRAAGVWRATRATRARRESEGGQRHAAEALIPPKLIFDVRCVAPAGSSFAPRVLPSPGISRAPRRPPWPGKMRGSCAPRPWPVARGRGGRPRRREIESPGRGGETETDVRTCPAQTLSGPHVAIARLRAVAPLLLPGLRGRCRRRASPGASF